MNLATFRRKALRDELEVEHILRAAKSGEPGLAELLETLIVDCKWSDGREFPDGSIEIPYRKWARVAAAYCEGGSDGLIALTRREPDYLRFALAMLVELKSNEAVTATLAMAGALLGDPAGNARDAREVAETFNLLLLPKTGVVAPPAVAASIRAFLHALLASKSDDTAKAMALYALRWVGDAESMAMIKGLPPLEEDWASVPAEVMRTIKKRL